MPIIKDGHLAPASHDAEVLDFDSFIASNSAATVSLPPDVDLGAIADWLHKLERIEIQFPGFVDGRGFSIARQLREHYSYSGQLIAAGPLIPDQYVYALQCGFDAVKVDEDTYKRQSESDWYMAMDAFGLTYQRGYAIKSGPAQSIFDARRTSKRAGDSDPFFGLSAERALSKALTMFKGEIALASSMGVDSAVLLHMISRIDPSVPVLFLETGKHFKQTLAYRDMLISDLGLTNFINITPDPADIKRVDPDGMLNAADKDACCDLRKVRPLDRRITGYAARITGRKRYQTPQRAQMPILELGGRQAKVNPLAYWSAKDVTRYIRQHDLPPHPLLSSGYLSIGCEPCTTRVSEGEDPRAGRWRNTEKTECGIHYIDGKWVPIQAAPNTHEVF